MPPLQSTSPSPPRFYELDLLRGVAVILMVVYHFCYDLEFFNIRPIPSFFWLQQFYGFPITIMFVGIAGISLSLAAFKAKDSQTITKKLVKRGAKLFLIGLFITAATWVYPHDGFIVFGVLHLIGISTILAIPFLIAAVQQKSKIALILPLIFGTSVLILAGAVQKIQGPLYLAFLGIHPGQFYTLDYEPLFPWFGVVLIGVALGFWLYPKGKRRFALPLKMQNVPNMLKPLAYLGQHSLIIYLIHQPIILGILWLSGAADLGIF
ncbi:MAG: DUF1624 domain-containing protein [Methanimicrococcus sp.]|nr:DUF1624 domain-containing protein [Methanimicrococcus sp.]